MEGGDQHAILADQHGVALGRSESLHVWPHAFNNGSTNEDHLDGHRGEDRNLVTDFARELAAIGVAGNGDIGESQRRLRGIANFTRHQDCARASAKNRAASRGMFTQSVVEAFLDKEFPLRGTFAAGQNNRVHPFEIARRAHKYIPGAQALELRGMRFKIALNGEYADFHAFFPCLHEIATTIRAFGTDPSLRSGECRAPSWLRPVPRRLRERPWGPDNASWPLRWPWRAFPDRWI